MLTIKFEGNNTSGYRYVLGSVLLHQSVIGLETKTAMDKYGIVPDIIIGCAGGGYFDLVAYEKFNNGEMGDFIPTDEDILAGLKGSPPVPRQRDLRARRLRPDHTE